MDSVTLPLVISTGLLDSFNPCAISVLLIYIALMFAAGKEHKEILRVGLVYVLTVYTTYLLIGLFYSQIIIYLVRLSNLNLANYILIGTGILTIIFGLLNIKEYYFPNSKFTLRMPFGVRRKINELAHKGDIPSTIILGAVVAASELPCSGAVYIGILNYLSVKETLFSGFLYLVLYNLMFVLPLIVIFVLASNRMTTEKMINLQERMGRKMHLLLAALMIALGVLVIYLR